MNSLRQTATTHEEQQALLRAQIAALQAQLDPSIAFRTPEDVAREKEKKGKRVLVGDSPVKDASKRRKIEQPQVVHKGPPFPQPVNTPALQSSTPTQHPSTSSRPPRPSNMLSSLQRLHATPEPRAPEPVQRSSAFHAPAVQVVPVVGRDEELKIIEQLDPGPRECKPSAEDPRFERLEPNSGIRLSSRRVSHEDVRSYLTGRFYLPPSLLYSVVRLSSDKQGYDVPVSGDWVTIAVVAERGEVKLSRGAVRKDGEVASSDEEGGKKKDWRARERKKLEEEEKGKGKKYITLKLVDFGNKPAGGGTGSTKGGSSRGDAMLCLLLFEANQVREEPDEEGGNKVYKGGSGGAFELWAATLREGSVVALLNPRILRPFQGGDNRPHRTDNILALTPSTEESVVVLGQSLDLARCAARRKDGSQCNGWCDRRANDVCEYHIQQRVKTLRAARPEFAVGTSGFTTSRPSSGPDYQKKQGLLPAKGRPMTAPRDSGGGPTYIMEGHVLRSNARPAPQEEFVGEKLGRERVERDLRKKKRSKMDEELKDLLDGKTTKLTIHGNRIGRVVEESTEHAKVKSAFGPDTVKKIGFNPAFMGRGGQAEADKRKAEAKNRDVHALLDRRDVHIQPKLGSRPGVKVRSGVSVPAHLADPPAPSVEDAQHSLSDLELLEGEKNDPARMVDADSSDLEIEDTGTMTTIPAIKRKTNPAEDHLGLVDGGDLCDLEIEDGGTVTTMATVERESV
ncbi:hypothetical protein DACRYDRAFT_117278 [Dacryopinax primogenitus]|uniref:Zinc finger Mcm10/DnaG-type domain-containing protein n=1 Tax=Dacryopinax primogenitus (strain DJM 731) TaxID=1858805 RepID=M5FX00_DACPD|nr:uncharacterized protein DACRYDRAFT_117278 [Dacryopinax primogenitus]EJU00220.1 hypothetical protein DACRYDRAFT_117278 [Dacryopinax primogenitus]